MIYLDSTYIVKCYVQERGTSEVLRLVQGHPGRASCGHGRIEFWTGIHRQVREGHLARADAEKVYRQFRLDGNRSQAGVTIPDPTKNFGRKKAQKTLLSILPSRLHTLAKRAARFDELSRLSLGNKSPFAGRRPKIAATSAPNRCTVSVRVFWREKLMTRCSRSTS